MKSDAKPASKRRRAAPQEEIADLRAELDDFIRRVPTLSQIELNQAKERLIQKVALTTDKAASPLMADLRKKIDLNIIPFIIIGTAAWFIVRNQGDQEDRCGGYKREAKCKRKYPCDWCPRRTCPDGHEEKGYCYDSTEPSSKERCVECKV